MKIVSLNIECNKHYERFIPFLSSYGTVASPLARPDVICLQEVLEEDVSYLKEKLGYVNFIFKPFEYVVSHHPSYKNLYGKKHGIAIFSNNIINSGHSYYWGNENYCHTPFDEYVGKFDQFKNYVFVWADVQDESGKTYRCVTTHFPVTKEGESTPHQLEILTPLFAKLDELGDFVLCGDFNAPRGNETFRRIAKKYKDNIPEKYITSLDQNIHRVKGLMFMVDGLFTTNGYIAKDVSLVDGVSDHMAIVGTIESV
jgi:endonuclease/exonuclease/phosphatase family metal-dependent hydrolase